MEATMLRQVMIALLLIGFMYGCQTTPNQTADRELTDGAVTAKVKSKLAEERPGTLTQVKVDTVKNIVYLTGTVPTNEDRARAEQVARNIDGVRNVVNNLEVLPPR
jgi:hyperosmotically inducible periplasmic protein